MAITEQVCLRRDVSGVWPLCRAAAVRWGPPGVGGSRGKDPLLRAVSLTDFSAFYLVIVDEAQPVCLCTLCYLVILCSVVRSPDLVFDSLNGSQLRPASLWVSFSWPCTSSVVLRSVLPRWAAAAPVWK